MVSEPLASVLRSGRPTFNARFAAARRQYGALEPGAFRVFLEETVDPLARAVHAASPPPRTSSITQRPSGSNKSGGKKARSGRIRSYAAGMMLAASASA